MKKSSGLIQIVFANQGYMWQHVKQPLRRGRKRKAKDYMSKEMGKTEFESVQIEEFFGGKVVKVIAAGKLTRESYRAFTPELDELAKKHGKIRLLFEMIHFEGWTMGAVWEDLKFGCKHFNDIERVAIVGDKKWEKGMAVVCKPFTLAKVRYFDISDLDSATDWIMEGMQ